MDQMLEDIGELPFVLLLNKVDLVDDREIPDELPTELTSRCLAVIRTSAKTGDGVSAAFEHLIQATTP